MLPKQRIRGVILTPKGLHKLEFAKQQTEFNDNGNKRFTLINLSVQTGLDSHTLCKIFNSNNKVDRYSLTRCFQAFKILLEPDDYDIATIPLLITSSELQQGETYKDKTVGRQERFFEKCFALTLCTFRSPLTPLKKGGTGIKVPLLKGDLGGSRTFCYHEEDFSNIL